MTETFSTTYADAYDAFYASKDYGVECDFLERVFRASAPEGVASVLDLGCGTGAHALRLASRGYDVVGVDRSEAMLAVARAKASEGSGRARFVEGDLRTLDLDRQFDAVTMLFAVLGYQVTNADVLAALRSTRRHLRPGGLFVFDVWYGPAVLHQQPGERLRMFDDQGDRILRHSSGTLDRRRHLCRVEYQVWRLQSERIVSEARETHIMRFFFSMELELLLDCAGFDLVTLSRFPEGDRDPDQTTWNAAVVARARASG